MSTTSELRTPPAGTTSAHRVRSSGSGLLLAGWSRGAGLLVAVAVLLVACLISIGYGARPMALSTVWDALWNRDLTVDDHVVVHALRLPRTALGLLAGSALALSGALLQGITRNPVADPGIFGIQSGASLAVVATIHLFGLGAFGGYVWVAFLGAAVAGFAVFSLASAGRAGASPVKLALAGAVLTAMMTSITTGILLVDVAALEQFRFWVVGSLAGRDASVAWGALPFIAVGSVVAMALARPLNALALGEDVARSLGQRVGLTRAMAILTVVVLAGAATAACGPIAFLGLMLPHIARSITGPDHRWVLPWSAVLGPILLLGADVVGRVIARPGELQVGIVTAVIGAPCFIALVRRRSLAEV